MGSEKNKGRKEKRGNKKEKRKLDKKGEGEGEETRRPGMQRERVERRKQGQKETSGFFTRWRILDFEVSGHNLVCGRIKGKEKEGIKRRRRN